MIHLNVINDALSPAQSDAWHEIMMDKDMFILPEGRMAAYLPDLKAFLTLHNLDYEVNE